MLLYVQKYALAVCTCAVRNCLECHHKQHGPRTRGGDVNGRPSVIDALIAGSRLPSVGTNGAVEATMTSPVKDVEKLLQEMDINRLRAVVYRDVVGVDVLFMFAMCSITGRDKASSISGTCHRLFCFCAHGVEVP